MKSRSKVGNKKGTAYRTPSWHRGAQSLLNKNYGPSSNKNTPGSSDRGTSIYDKFRRHRSR